MLASDRATQSLGATLDAIGPGSATLSMTVSRSHVNGFGMAHGGIVATVADSAFAVACNTYDQLTVASGFTVDFLAPAAEGDRLTAVAREVSRTGRTGVYDVEVTNQTGRRIALFRGRSYRPGDRRVIGSGVGR